MFKFFQSKTDNSKGSNLDSGDVSELKAALAKLRTKNEELELR